MKEPQVKEYFEVINIVYIQDEQCYGTVENLGAYASVVKYKKDDVEVEELLDNADFIIVDEIVFTHVIEDGQWQKKFFATLAIRVRTSWMQRDQTCCQLICWCASLA